MLKLIIIIAAWATPGILLFLYLLYISKRAQGPSAEDALPAARATPPDPANNNLRELDLKQSWIVPSDHRAPLARFDATR